jgi:hypothetical protein
MKISHINVNIYDKAVTSRMAAVGGGCCWRFLSLIIRIVAAAGVAAAGDFFH